MAVMKKLNELQGNSERQYNELKNKINEQKEYFTKETETLKNNQTEIQNQKVLQKLKNSRNKMKNILESSGNYLFL